MATLKLKLGSKILEITAEGNAEEMIKSLAFWSGLPEKCSKCGSDKLSLFYKKPSKGVYYGLKCLDCTAELTFHQKEADKSFYITKDDTFKVFTAITNDAGKGSMFNPPLAFSNCKN